MVEKLRSAVSLIGRSIFPVASESSGGAIGLDSARRPDAPTWAVPEPSISIEQGMDEYFATGSDVEVLSRYHVIRAILIGRKLIRKERSDKGGKHVGKLGMPSDVALGAEEIRAGELGL